MLSVPDEAKKFHRQSAIIHHDLHDNWSHALALTHLADAHDSIGETSQAHHVHSDALNLIGAYQDRRATGLQQLLTRAIRTPDG